MRDLLLTIGVCAAASLQACEHAKEGRAGRSGGIRVADGDPKGPRVTDSERSVEAPRSDAASERRRTSRSSPRRQAGAGVRNEPRGASEDPPQRRSRDGRGRAPRRITGDELLVTLDARSLPGGVYEIDRSADGGRGVFSTQRELDEFLERINVRTDWFQVIRVGPWTIRVVRDTFFDPYRRDSGWIDIDELDGPHGR